MHTGEVTTNDDVQLQYVEAGTGPDLLLVSGWTLTAELWRHQIEEFSSTYHVVAYDHRGHGQSDHPPYGYRMARLAADAHEVIEALGLSDITMVGHSMGCGVAFAYWDLYRDEHLRRLVLIDEPPALSSQPDWPQGMAAQVGTPHTAEGLPAFTAALRGQQAGAIAAGALDRMATARMPPAEREQILSQMLLTEREAASLLMFSNATQDWRDLLPGVAVPALVIGGGASIFSAASIENLAAAIPGAVVRIIPAADRGSHLSFLENPSVVNGAIRAFLDSTA
jgi:pimeloyl-ACP methyl ester carboxylesterase